VGVLLAGQMRDALSVTQPAVSVHWRMIMQSKLIWYGMVDQLLKFLQIQPS